MNFEFEFQIEVILIAILIYISFIEIRYPCRSRGLDTTNDIYFFMFIINDNIAITSFLLISGHLGFFINGHREKMETVFICSRGIYRCKNFIINQNQHEHDTVLLCYIETCTSSAFSIKSDPNEAKMN